MKGFYIEVKNDLLDPKHRKAIGMAIWEFMWCLDKVTSITEEGMGTVNKGRPLKLEDLAKELGTHTNSVSTNLNKLNRAGYITLKRTPYGLLIWVNKASKRFNQKSESQKTVNHKKLEENPKNSESNYNKTNTRQNNNSLSIVSPSLSKYSKIGDITEEQFAEIANFYQVPVSFVRNSFDSLVNYCESHGKTYKNYLAALRNFVKSDMVRIKTKAMADDRKRGIDATRL